MVPCSRPAAAVRSEVTDLRQRALAWAAATVLAVSPVGVSLVMNHEAPPGKPPLVAYKDAVGVWTICWGHTAGVRPGQRATKAQCHEYLQKDLEAAQSAVRRLVKVPLSQPIFDALTSFVLNVGEGNFARSTLLRKLNSRNYAGACWELDRWVYGKGTKEPLRGLIVRRADERNLCLRGVR